MPSPDFSPYVNLTLYDKDPASIYLDAITYAQNVALPEFNPRVGSIEEALLQAVAYSTSQLVGTINRIPDGLMEGILNLYGFERQQSISARVTIFVEVTSSTGTTIPTGAVFSYTTTVDGAQETYFFVLVEDIVIASGDTTGSGEAECLQVGVIPTIPSGEIFAPVSGASGVISAESLGTMTQGEDEETDTSYFQRGAAFLASRSESLATSTQIQNYLGVYAQEIQRAYVSDLTQFRYMRVSSVTRTDSTVTAVVDVPTGTWTSPTATCSFLESDVTTGVTRVAVRYADDTAATEPINGTALSGATYIIDTAVYDSVAGTYIIEFETNSTLDNVEEYTPSTSAPFHSVTADGTSPDRYIEILLLPEDYNTILGAVGLVFSKSTGMPVQNSAYLPVQTAVQDKTIAGLLFTSISPLMVDLNIEAVIEHKSTYGAVSVRQAVEAALEAYLSTSTWTFGTNVYVNTLIGIASSVPGVQRVVSLDLSIATDASLGALAEYSATEGGHVDFRYPFILPNLAEISVTGPV